MGDWRDNIHTMLASKQGITYFKAFLKTRNLTVASDVLECWCRADEIQVELRRRDFHEVTPEIKERLIALVEYVEDKMPFDDNQIENLAKVVPERDPTQVVEVLSCLKQTCIEELDSSYSAFNYWLYSN